MTDTGVEGERPGLFDGEDVDVGESAPQDDSLLEDERADVARQAADASFAPDEAG